MATEFHYCQLVGRPFLWDGLLIIIMTSDMIQATDLVQCMMRMTLSFRGIFFFLYSLPAAKQCVFYGAMRCRFRLNSYVQLPIIQNVRLT
jgi:hypothetical protein